MKVNDTKPLFIISIAAELTDSHPRSLMLYEKKHIIKPSRTESNRRLYSPHNIAEIKFIQYLTQDKGLNLAGVKIITEVITYCRSKKFDLNDIFFSDYPDKIPF